MSADNQFLTTDWLSMDAMDILDNSLEVTSHFYKGFNKEFQRPFAVGESVRVEFPPAYFTRDGLQYDPQGIQEIYTTITCNQVVGLDFEWNDVEAALKLERDDARLNEFYYKMPVTQIAQDWDLRSARFGAIYANMIAGTLGTDPTSFTDFSNLAEQKMFEMACPQDGEKGFVITPSVNRALVNSGVQYFNPSDAISRQYKKGIIGMQSGLTFYRSMSLYRHTAGTWASSVTVSGAGQSGSSLLVACTSGDTFKAGDKIGIGTSTTTVYNVNPRTRQRVNSAYAAVVTVTADVTATGATATIPIYPPIYGPGSPFQNVDALPASGATLTLFPGTVSPNGKVGTMGLAVHPWAFGVVFVPLELPKNQQVARQSRDPETGVSIRFVRAWDPVESRMINRFDTLGGYGPLYTGNCAVAALGA